MRYRLLGPLEVRGGGRTIDLGGPRQHAVLATLLIGANDTVSLAHLCEAVWDVPPVAAESNVRTYVAKIRRQLAEVDPDAERLVTRRRGYQLTVHPGELDLAEFEEHVEHGRDASGGGDWFGAAAAFAAALDLWHGRPFENLEPGPVLRAERTRLEERHLTAAEGLARARIELGRHDSAVAELRQLVDEHPTREELAALLMLALHGTGRQAEALDVFAQARARLVGELGIEPGERLRAAQQTVLAGGQAEVAAEPAPVVTVSAHHQLPMDIADFTGREATLETLYRQVDRADVESVAICVIEGMAGVGKTRFAVHAAHELVRRGRYGDVQLWADLRGFDPESPPVEPAGLLERFLKLLGVPRDQIPDGVEERAALYRDRLAGRKALVLLDNAVDEAQVRPLLPGTAGCLVLVTSRRTLPDLDGAGLVRLDLFSTTEAVALFARIAGESRVAAEPAVAARVVSLCGHLPLAVTIAAQRLHNRSTWTVGDLGGRLEASTGRLDQLHGRSRAVRAVFDLSYRALEPATRWVFRLLGLHPADDFTADSVAALADLSPVAADAILEMLCEEHLLHEVAPGRYRLHDLVRLYARSRTHTEESDVDRQAAVRRLLDWYLHAAAAASRRLNPDGRPVPLDPGRAPAHLPDLGSYAEALTWCEAERGNLVAVVRVAAERGEHTIAWKLPCAMLSFLYLRKHWDDWVATHLVALASADRAGDTAGMARVLNGLGVVYSDLGRLTDAIGCHRAGVSLFGEIGDIVGAAWNFNNLGVAYDNDQDYEAAADCYRNAVPLFREAGNRHGESIALSNLGDAYRELGRYDAALERMSAALDIQHDTGDRPAQRFTLCSLGDLYRDTARPQRARDSYQQALAISRELGDRRGVAKLLGRLGDLWVVLGRPEVGRELLAEAREILVDLDAPEADLSQRLPTDEPTALPG
ncbi:AfsR/SARP family transcriptional regulator [Actinophytocola xinjiangensis]|uniref:AfsR/SARP family transcriptional regulator n=1 Tax=Actinophytocola xinjiangensis TaxID=485602 RepID=UPI000A0447EA|nr:AfsR/SARP family transcriptional regulator [Actinophytocola xinjiangensis]